ncbi:hypothetical protein HYPSUDRAFT_87281 [Hypholoma sublateritium FD-334 SS-4]|uniref:Uncharacterized protein n=1 Tax=Hypholoma sublateritium (strain FD-334 SS-4) TaxID=945553 RepID=A0A0D2P1Z9_HYPSF|nr:hypothetical protein HYPSUDRAFT_87281 [Hypholoma sublateritium FD-334 SS-4]
MKSFSTMYKITIMVLACITLASSAPAPAPVDTVDCDAEDITKRGLALCF